MKAKWIFTILFVALATWDVAVNVSGSYQYSKHYSSHWNLAVKASSIEKKIEGIDKFVAALENSPMKGQYNAIFMETPNNSFDENFAALKSLQARLHEIQAMDVKSFEYNTALQQITQQEQNEAHAMLDVFEGIWWKNNYISVWGWIGFLNEALLLTLFFVVGGLFITDDTY